MKMGNVITPEEKQYDDYESSIWLNLAQRYEHFILDKNWEEQRLTFMRDLVLLGAMIVDSQTDQNRVAKELHELNKTLKDILREMRKRKV